MGILTLNNQSGESAAGSILYSFTPEAGAEYTTPLCTEDAIYKFAVNFTDTESNNGVVIEIYAVGNNTVPVSTISLFSDEPYAFPSPIGKIRVLSAGNSSAGNYRDDRTTLTISRSVKVAPNRTSTNNDGFGDIFVHVEAHNDWTESGSTRSGYGWGDTRRWQGWSYNWNYTGVYRIARSGEQASIRWQYKPHTSQTWQNLANFPSDPELGSSTRFTQGEIYDTENFTYVIFRCDTTTTSQTVSNTVDNTTVYSGNFNVYLARYNKSGNTWNMLGAYAITTYGNPSFTVGPRKFFIAQDNSGISYLFPYGTSNERTSNTFFRYNLTTGARSQASDAANPWNDGAFIGTGLTGSTSAFFASPTNTGVTGADTSTRDYVSYNPLTNTWTVVAAPSRVGEASAYNRGGTPFRYSSNEVGLIGRRTYTTNNVAPSSTDRYYGRRLWTYNVSTATWTDRSADLGDFYPHIMRPSDSVVNDMRAFQPQSSDWDGRFLTFLPGDSQTSRGNYQYVNTKRPRRVEIIGQTGRPRGEMSVGSISLMAFGHIGDYNSTPRTHVNTNSSTTYAGITFESPVTGGWEIVYLDGTVKYGPSKFHPTNVIYDTNRNKYFVAGWQQALSKWVSTTNADRVERTSYVVDEKTGEFIEQSTDFYGNTTSPGNIQVVSAGLALTSGSHFIRRQDANNWFLTNLVGGYAAQGSGYPYQGNADYRWDSVTPYSDNQPSARTLTHPDNNGVNHQIVAWGNGPRNVLGIPEGTLWWNGRILRQYSFRTPQAPFTALQTGWRIIYTAPEPGMQTGGAYYGTPHIWRDKNFAICPGSNQDKYYVFDLNNLYTREPKIISAHLPIETAATPAYTPASSATISSNSINYMSNRACIAGVEIIYGGIDVDGVRTAWYNDNIYLVKDPSPAASVANDAN